MKILLVASLALMLFGCNTQKETTRSEEVNKTILKDSTTYKETLELIPITVPLSTVTIKITPSEFETLPVGAVFASKKGQASVSVSKTEYGEIAITATCDSLLFIVEQKTVEINRLTTENSQLSKSLSELQQVKIREPTGWQWFWIYIGYISGAYFITKTLIRKWKK